MTTAAEFMEATASLEGLRGVSIYTGQFELYDDVPDAPEPVVPKKYRKQIPKPRKAVFPGISKYFHFEYDGDKLTAWNYPQIGVGVTVPVDPFLLHPNKNKLIVTQEQHEGKSVRVKPGHEYWQPIGTKPEIEGEDGQVLEEVEIEEQEEPPVAVSSQVTGEAESPPDDEGESIDIAF